MRTIWCAALLTCCLFGADLCAATLTTAQAQQLVSAAQSATMGKPVEVTLSVAGKNVVFTVTRDAVGNVIARPVPGPDSAGIDISQVTVQMRVKANGSIEPTTMVVVSGNQTILSFQVQLNQDGSIAGLSQAGTFAVGDSVENLATVGGIKGTEDPNSKNASNNTAQNDIANNSFSSNSGYSSGFPSAQQSLPAGAGTGDISRSTP
jgi:hypothetical protein